MALSPGTWLGHYEVLDHIGSGGMGEVYRARDNKLQREVALKLLPKAFAQDPERLARFRREAQILAQLNHPNIAAIYSVEQTGDTHFLVMELAPGETLRDRIKRGPVPVEESLDIAKQIAAGLECAHEKSIVHRDLKPANIKVTPEGVVKILDFGLARAFAADTGSSDPANSPTLTGMTAPGTILGTAAYMSPEQARGKTVDKRSDIWALGCVLYEMLTGKHAYDGEDVTDILASVVKSEPDWQALPENTPPGIRTLLRRCLQKDKDRRSRDAAEIQLQIQEALEAPVTEETKAAKAVPLPPLWRRAVPWGVGAMLAAVVGIGAWTLRPIPTPTVTRFAVSLPPDETLQPLRANAPCPSIAVSPDGSLVAYVAIQGTQQQLYLREMDSLEATPVPGGAGAQVYSVFFSPDGQWVAFGADGMLKKSPTSGGAPVTVANVTFCMGGVAWGADDTIIFPRPGGLLQVAAAGGTPEPANLNLSAEEQANVRLTSLFPKFLPGGNVLLFTVPGSGSNNLDDRQIVAQRLDTGERRVLVQGGVSPHYVSTGHLVYARAGTIIAGPFDLERLEVTGGPITLVEGLAQSGNGFSEFDVSENGALVYMAGGGPEAQDRTLVWVDRNGTAEPLGAPPGAYGHPQLSPDGRQLAVTVEFPKRDIWVYDISRSALTRLTFEGANSRPLWTPDGKRIAFRSVRATSDLFWKLADGTGAEEEITTRMTQPSSISPDGKLAFYYGNGATSGRDIWTVPLEDERTPSVFLQTPFDEAAPKISPDGQWLAYVSNESGRSEIFVRAFPGPGGKWQISTEGGSEPLWARNGRELFYRSGDKVMAVDITTQPSFQAGTPRMLFEGKYVRRNNETNYDVSPDGQRFLMIQADEQQAAATQLHVVLNWFEELKQRVSAP